MDGHADHTGGADETLTPRLVSALYVEAMVLADEVRAYFDEAGREERDLLSPLLRVTFSCESLKVTTRLMHVIAWLLTRRAVEAGELTAAEARDSARRLGEAAGSEDDVTGLLPHKAHALIGASLDLYERVARLDESLAPEMMPLNPARTLLNRLESAF